MSTDKFSDNVNTKGKITQGRSVSSKIDVAGDEDWFKVNLKRGNTYEFILSGPGVGKGTLPDGFLDLYNGSGISVFDQTDGFTDDLGRTHMYFYASTNGNYFIDAYSDSGSNTGSYNLKFLRSDVAGDDVTDGTDTEGKIKVGQSKNGHLIYNGDDDWYAINLKGNTNYAFQVYTQSYEDGDLTLDLRDASGSIVNDAIVQRNNDGNVTVYYETGNSGGKFFLDVGSTSSSVQYYNLTAGFGSPPG